MTKPGRSLAALLLASLLALVAAGCGVDSSSDAGGSDTPTTEAPTTDVPTTDEVPTTDVDETTTTAEDDETTTTEDDGDETTTTEDEGDDPTIPTIPEGFESQFRDQLEIGFESAGLTSEQASCLADAYVEEFGSDTSRATDFQAMLDLFEGCDINPADLGGG